MLVKLRIIYNTVYPLNLISAYFVYFVKLTQSFNAKSQSACTATEEQKLIQLHVTILSLSENYKCLRQIELQSNAENCKAKSNLHVYWYQTKEQVGTD